jgi:uncharacterized protein (TIGR00255 family)
MIKSMTGFGQSQSDNGQLQLAVEVKSLNSKFLDLNIRLPKNFSEKEIELRTLISDKLERGKISVSIDCQRHGQSMTKQTYNEDLFAAYYAQLKKLADKVVSPSYDNLFSIALNSPDVIENASQDDTLEKDWEEIKKLLVDAVNKCDGFRKTEGKSLELKLEEYCNAIKQNLVKVEELDPKRIERIRERIKGNVVAYLGEEGYDTNRLEQEIIFYVEKLDIHEERVRLKTHLDYFLQILSEPQSNGKKLSFVSQEIGREINTIGSKANDADIQKLVVLMKEDLEKIKEQLNNVL